MVAPSTVSSETATTGARPQPRSATSAGTSSAGCITHSEIGCRVTPPAAAGGGETDASPVPPDRTRDPPPPWRRLVRRDPPDPRDAGNIPFPDQHDPLYAHNAVLAT